MIQTQQTRARIGQDMIMKDEAGNPLLIIILIILTIFVFVVISCVMLLFRRIDQDDQSSDRETVSSNDADNIIEKFSLELKEL